MTADKKTIGITAANERVLSSLVAAGHFGSEIEAAKFAMAHAVTRDVGRGTTEGAGTKWNVGSVDADGALRSVIEALHPDEPQPYRLIEHLMNEGLKLFNAGTDLPPDVAGLLSGREARQPENTN